MEEIFENYACVRLFYLSILTTVAVINWNIKITLILITTIPVTYILFSAIYWFIFGCITTIIEKLAHKK